LKKGIDPVGMFYAGYRSGPRNVGLTLPLGSCLCFNAEKRIVLTATHILKNAPEKIENTPAEIKPKFINFLVGFHFGKQGWQLFLVKDTQEILPEVTALYIKEKSIDGLDFPKSLKFPISQQQIKQFFPVFMVGYPASIQTSGLKPDKDMLEVFQDKPTAYNYVVSGIVSAYFSEHSPRFIHSDLLPAFVVDNAVLPGMSGGAVMKNIVNKYEVVGMTIKNIVIKNAQDNEAYNVIHTLAISLHDISV
jgi:hypothetical protein